MLKHVSRRHHTTSKTQASKLGEDIVGLLAREFKSLQEGTQYVVDDITKDN